MIRMPDRIRRLGPGEYLMYGKFRIENHGYDRIKGATQWVGFGESGREIARCETLRSVVKQVEAYIGKSEEICKTYPRLTRISPDEYLYDLYFKISPSGSEEVRWVAENENGAVVSAGSTLNECVENLISVLIRPPTINGECCI